MDQPRPAALVPFVTLKQLSDQTGARRDILQTIARQLGVAPVNDGARARPVYRLGDAQRILDEFNAKHRSHLAARASARRAGAATSAS